MERITQVVVAVPCDGTTILQKFIEADVQDAVIAVIAGSPNRLLKQSMQVLGTAFKFKRRWEKRTHNTVHLLHLQGTSKCFLMADLPSRDRWDVAPPGTWVGQPSSRSVELRLS